MCGSHEQGHEDGNDEAENDVDKKGPVVTGPFF